MAGHSKWHNIQVRKGKADKLRANAFTKLARGITIAAQEGGGDPVMNFSLRLAIEKAKTVNMPKDNIERAIKRGTGELKEGALLEEMVYEAFGPGGVALLIEAVSDNRNRTAGDLKAVLGKHGGSLAGPGSVQWQFELRGVIRLTMDTKQAMSDWEALELDLMDAGVEDIKEIEEGVEISAPKERFQTMLEAVSARGIEPDDSGLEWTPKEHVSLDEATMQKLEILQEALEELDDVSAVYTNQS